MTHRLNRRDYLRTGLAGAAFWGLGDFGFLRGLPLVRAEDQAGSSSVVLDPSIAPLVQLIEQTPQERLLEEIGARIRGGLNYRDILAALLLAGVKNIEPRPEVGFKFHGVLAVNAAHLASLNSPPEHRWLPIFWALDHYKSSAARDERERNWTMPAVDEAAVPPAHRAREMFLAALDNWDEAPADAAIAGLSRSAGLNDIYEIFFRYGCRDFRSIGHKAIFVANSWRTLQVIGRQHAEPVLRSLAYALLMHEGDNPAKRDEAADGPFRQNLERIAQIKPEWLAGARDSGATQSLLQSWRTATPEAACEQVVAVLNGGAGPQTIWDALFVFSAELLMRQPGIVALHAVTTTNALRFAFETTANDETRRLVLLQNVAFVMMFREAMRQRGALADTQLDTLQPGELAAVESERVADIFRDVSADKPRAAAKTLAFLNGGGPAQELIDAARVLVFMKGRDAHDYKFSSAILEDYERVSPEWRARYLAGNMFHLTGSGAADNQLVQRTRAALDS